MSARPDLVRRLRVGVVVAYCVGCCAGAAALVLDGRPPLPDLGAAAAVADRGVPEAVRSAAPSSAAAGGAVAAQAAGSAATPAGEPESVRVQVTDEPASVALPGPPPKPQPQVGLGRVRKVLPSSADAADPCGPQFRPGATVLLSSATVNGALVVSWYHTGDASTVRYRVGVQPQEWVPGEDDDALTRAPIVWDEVAPPDGCGTVDHTVTGARSGVEYRVWLEVDVTTPETGDEATRLSVGRLSGVTLDG